VEASAGFFVNALGFERHGDALILEGGPYGELVGLPGARFKLLRLMIGAEVLELTEILDPGPGARLGRPIPADQGIQDLAHWQLRLEVADLHAIADLAEALGGRLISPGIVELKDQAAFIGATRALQLADPDGHQLQLSQG